MDIFNGFFEILFLSIARESFDLCLKLILLGNSLGGLAGMSIFPCLKRLDEDNVVRDVRVDLAVKLSELLGQGKVAQSREWIRETEVVNENIVRL